MVHYWAGFDGSYEVFQASVARAAEFKAKAGNALSDMQVPPIYNREGSVGVIDIQGSLVPGSTGWMRMFGILGYEDIKSAIVEGIKDRSAKTLMLNVKSGGGSVNGTSETAHFIRSAASVKPTSTYASFMGSAAMWIGSAAPHITLAESGEAGSIGILRIHSEGSKADETAGITTTVMRAGKYKARINPYEPLTDEVKAEEQKKLDFLYDRFIQTVAHQRSTTVATADTMYGQGRTFIGSMALDVGLVDVVGDMSQALAYAKSNTNKLDAAKVSFVVTKSVAPA